MAYLPESTDNFEARQEQFDELQDNFGPSSGRFVRERHSAGRRQYVPKRSITSRSQAPQSSLDELCGTIGPESKSYSREQLLDFLQQVGESAIVSAQPLKMLELSMPLDRPHQIYNRIDRHNL